MLTPNPTNAFKGDVSRLAVRKKDIVKLFSPLLILLNGQQLPPGYRDHPLKGEWNGFREFHVEFDWVVIYRVAGDSLELERTGTHGELFR